MTNQDLIFQLISQDYLKSADLKNAFLKADRKNFVPANLQAEAYSDIALPLFEGQTISQPSTVAFMLDLLEPAKGNKVLEIGAGSGWLTALLSNLIGRNGFVFAFEINRKVGEFGIRNLKKHPLKNFQYVISDAKKHWRDGAPYDRIISGAAFSEINEDFFRLLSNNGTAVIPTKQNSICKIYKNNKGDISTLTFPGFLFVPLI